MNNQIDIAEGFSAKSKKWKNKKVSWPELVARLAQATKTQETYKEYMLASREDQLKIKDVGGYVGGYLRGGRRSPKNVVYRQLATLDIDFAHTHFWDDFLLAFDCAAVLHSTHKHHPDSPRLRLVIPLSREASPDEYVAFSRKVAGVLGIDLFDNTTFETNRLMFWPSTPKDVDYYFEQQKGDFLDVDEILGMYQDWTDTSLWPTSTKHLDKVKDITARQEDPETKKGVVGMFCRTYNISEAIEKFLSEEYDEAGDDRYTYKMGSTSSGLVVYDNKFSYSHHGTDPTSGKLCNSFDLVRLHKFGHLDDGPTKGTPKSYAAMRDFVLGDDEVKATIARENFESSKMDFEGEESEYLEEEDLEWMKSLELDSKGDYLSNSHNLNLIFSNDPRLSGMFRYNQFSDKRFVMGNLPWRRVTDPEPMRNVDYSGVRNYMDRIYGITGSLKIEDSLALEIEKRAFHPVREYLTSLEWDGEPRIEQMFVDYFGAEDNQYHREAAKIMMAAAVTRIFRPGVKYDLVVTLVGAQGVGKSTFLHKLGGPWFSDTFITVHGKEALEQIQGSWIIEIAELAGLRKAEVEAIKHFISKQEDTFRAAYAKTPETYKRQCIFVGTTNNPEFLRDPTGNRRFVPITADRQRIKKDLFDTDHFTKDLIDQLWAEAYQLYKAKTPLYMKGDVEILARRYQTMHVEKDERQGIIEEFLDMPLPDRWNEMILPERRAFLEDDPLSSKSGERRTEVCAAEIWCECFNKDKKDMNRYSTRELNETLRSLDGWEYVNSTKSFPIYGKQKYYKRI